MTTQHRTREQCLAWLRSNPKVIAPKQRVTVDRFRPEDAEGVARLYHAVYGETFAIDYVYDPELIKEANLGTDLYQVVARTEAGDVVGLSALFHVTRSKAVIEAGSLMLLPEYRMGTLGFRLANLAWDMAENELKPNAVFVQSVTDHLTTQKLNRKFGILPFAFEVESMPPRPDGEGVRISLLDEFRVLEDCPHDVFLPGIYDSFLREIYAKRGLERGFLAGTAPTGETVCEKLSMDSASLTKLLVAEIGADFSEAVQELETVQPGRHVYQLQLPMTHPGLPEAVTEARRLGYFFGGLLPFWTDQDVLLMQKVAGEPDLEVPQVLADHAKELVAFIRADRESLS